MDHICVADVNGDALPDIVKTIYFSYGSEEWRVWLNNGSGWLSSGVWIRVTLNFVVCNYDSRFAA